jgi:uncharacterized protein
MKLCIPEAALTQHLVILGKTGAGKSSALRHIAEHCLSLKRRVCVVDPKGDWWGLKASRDGDGPGYPVIMFGDFKEAKASDVPINEHSGKHVAELIASGNRPCVLGFRGWMPAQMVRFWIDFSSTLFNANAGELFLFIDEVHNFAPKGKVLDPNAGKCLHWTNRLMSEGRGVGLVSLIASQRPQKVHNDTLTCCETLVAMRVAHAADRGAVSEWIDGCGDRTKGATVLNSLAQLSRGEAFVWSPEINFGPTRVKFPLFETFDSFAPPQLQRKVSGSGWADVDLDSVKEKLASVIQEAEANDPQKLKAEIRRLQSTAKPAVPTQVPALTPEQDKRLHDLLASASSMELHLRKQVDALSEQADVVAEIAKNARDLRAELKGRVPPSEMKLTAQPKVVQSARTDVFIAKDERSIVHGGIPPAEIGSGGKRRMLVALAQCRPGMNSRRLSLLTGISQSGGTWRTYMAELRGSGFIESKGDHHVITPSGRDALGDYERLPTGEALRNYWRQRLGDGGKRRIFDEVVKAYPNSISQEMVAHETGISTTGGTWRTYLAELRGLELIEGRGDLRACDDLFDE